MQYTGCPFFPYDNRWVFWWNGSIKTCRATDFSASPDVTAGSESIGTTADQNLDVHWEAMKYLNSSIVWTNWGAGANCADAPYRVRVNSNTDFWTELP
jgi:hypothetical protein